LSRQEYVHVYASARKARLTEAAGLANSSLLPNAVQLSGGPSAVRRPAAPVLARVAAAGPVTGRGACPFVTRCR
jgi:hypothetical protein